MSLLDLLLWNCVVTVCSPTHRHRILDTRHPRLALNSRPHPLNLSQIPSLSIEITPYAPFASDLIIAAICILTLWTHLGASKSRAMLFYWAMFVLGLGSLMAVEGFFWTYDFVFFGPRPIYLWDFTPLQRLRDLLVGLFGLANIPWLFVAWLTVTRWSESNTEKCEWVTWREWKDIWLVTVERAHLFKFGLLVVYPNALWISATIATDPTASTGYTIGQTFAVLVSIGSIICFFVDISELKRKHRKAIFWAVLKSTTVSQADDGLPQIQKASQAGDLRSPSTSD